MKCSLALVLAVLVAVGCKKKDAPADKPDGPPTGGVEPQDVALYTGDGYAGKPEIETDVEIDRLYQVNMFDQWFVSLGEGQAKDGTRWKTARAFPRPGEEAKLADLWPSQKVKVRGRLVTTESAGITMADLIAAQIEPVGPAPAHDVLTADELLKDFRADGAKAAGKYQYGGKWAKVTGKVSAVNGAMLTVKGDGPDGPAPNLITVEVASIVVGPNYLKRFQVGQTVTIRAKYPELNQDAVHFREAVWGK